MRPRNSTNTDGNFIGGLIVGISLPVLFVVFLRLIRWLGDIGLNGVVSWWTTEQTLTYVPLSVVFDVVGIGVILLLAIVVLSMPMIRRGTV